MESIFKKETRKIVFICLVSFVVLLGILHYFTPGYMILFHDSYRRLSYFPIAIGAILFGLKGGIALALLSCIGFIPHLFMFWAQGPEAYYSELSEIIFYLAAGIVIGFISSRENKLKKKLANSYKRFYQQSEKLVEAEKQLGQSQKLSTLGHVSASLAHEIRNPLSSIKGAAEILADDVPKGHEKHEFIEIIRSEISRLNNSVEKVLNYCKGEQQTNKSKPEPIEDIINKTLLLIDPKLKEKQIILIHNFDREAGDFLADSPAMIQVLLNILINSIDAVDRYGQITIDHFPGDKGYRIDISDNGPGIAKDIQQNLFEPFVTFKEKGTGLGLSITQKLLKSFGGDITLAESKTGGARFKIYLPKTKPIED